jgi:hypothetical protein
MADDEEDTGRLQASTTRGMTLIEAALREGNVTTTLDFQFAEVRATLENADEIVDEALDKYAGKQLVLDVLILAAALVRMLANEYGVEVDEALRHLRAGVDNPHEGEEGR